MSLSVAAVPPIGSLPDKVHQLDSSQKPEKVNHAQQVEQVKTPAKPTTIEQIERLEAAGKSVAQIATSLGLTPGQVDAELGIETSTTAVVVPTAIDVKA
jgi:hypothetical protein